MDLINYNKGDEPFTIEDYYNTPEETHVELINGVFYNMAPPNRIHQKISMYLSNVIDNYINSKGGSCEVYAAPFGVQLSADDDKTIVEPDISVICDKNKLTDKGCIGAPDWIIEIVSPSSASNDYIRKLGLYKKSKVKHYWIANFDSDSVAVYSLANEYSDPVTYSFSDTVPSGLYEDLAIDFSEIKRSAHVS